jgi:hypothetical protein
MKNSAALKKPATAVKFETREQWLQAALPLLQRDVFGKHGLTIPTDAKVACSWPGGGSARKRIGECWARKASSANINEMFISPKIEDVAGAFGALAVLVHECIHAIDDCANGHKKAFKRMAKDVGLEGKATSTSASEGLQGVLKAIAAELGTYPHRALNLSMRKVQKTYLVKCGCPVCTATWRITQQWIDRAEGGTLFCPICGSDEAVAESGGGDE